jgi:plastocyanin
MLLALLVALPAGAAPEGGEVRGRVSLVATSAGSRLSGAEAVFIYLEDAPAAGPLPAGPFEIQQTGKTFQPPVLVVPNHAQVSFPNLDAILHNVFSVSPGNRFDLGLHKSGTRPSASFGRPGVVAVYCNIHPQMFAHILVVSNPFFASAGADGTYRIPGVPPGDFQAVAWFPFGQPERKRVRVRASMPVELDFVLRERSDSVRHLRKDGSPYGGY